jgi:hypothetical protein
LPFERVADGGPKSVQRLFVDREECDVAGEFYDTILLSEPVPNVLREIDSSPFVC